MRAIIDILLRDLRARLRDRSAVMIGLLAPIGLTLVLAQLMPGPDVERRPLGYVAATPATATDTTLTTVVFPQLERSGLIRVRTLADVPAARAALDDESVDAVIAVAAEASGRTQVTAIRRPGAQIGGQIAEGIVRTTAAQTNGVTNALDAVRTLGPRTDASASQRIAQAVVTAPPTITVRDAPVAAGGLNLKTQVAAGMATFFLFFTVQFGLLSLLQERRNGTLARVLAAPVRPAQVLVAKLLVSFVLGVFSMTALVVVSRLLLGARFGSPIGVALLILAGVAAATSTVALVVGLVRTPDQAGMAQSMVALVLGIIGGSFFSMERSGGVGAVATKLTPHHWFSDGLIRMTGGAGWTGVLVPVGVLIGFAVVVGVPGILMARRTVRP